MSELHAGRETPSPSPGEWAPVDDRGSRWRLVCRRCGGQGKDVVVPPISSRERDKMTEAFLEEHAWCASTEGAT